MIAFHTVAPHPLLGFLVVLCTSSDSFHLELLCLFFLTRWKETFFYSLNVFGLNNWFLLNHAFSCVRQHNLHAVLLLIWSMFCDHFSTRLLNWPVFTQFDKKRKRAAVFYDLFIYIYIGYYNCQCFCFRFITLAFHLVYICGWRRRKCIRFAGFAQLIPVVICD